MQEMQKTLADEILITKLFLYIRILHLAGHAFEKSRPRKVERDVVCLPLLKKSG